MANTEFNPGKIPRPRVTPAYALGLVIVSLLIIALPSVYLSLLISLGYALGYHGLYHYDPILGLAGHSTFLTLVLYPVYLFPLIAGTAILLFMIKPFLAPERRPPQLLNLAPKAEPLLVSFIHEICDRLGTPRPKHIALSTDLSAAAGFRNGLRGLFTGELKLTLGMPLIVGLDSQQLAAVIAHEFGHFNQALSIRLTYFIRTVQAWLYRAAYDRDAWDEALENWSEQDDIGLLPQCFLISVRSGVGLTRFILKSVFWLGQAGVAFFLRQMELNADRNAIAIAGSKVFEATLLRLAVLDHAMRQVHQEMRATYQHEGRLPDNIAGLLNQHAAALSESVQSRWESAAGFRRTRLLDSHPATADRIRQARQFPASGVLKQSGPAMDLFHDFEIPAQSATLLYYHDLFGMPLPPEALYPIQTGSNAWHLPPHPHQKNASYFFGVLPWITPLTFSESELVPSKTVETLLNNLQRVRSKLPQARPEYSTLLNQLMQAETSLQLARIEWASSTPVFGPQSQPAPPATSDRIQAAEMERERLLDQLAPLGVDLKRRLHLGIQLVSTDWISDHIPEAKAWKRQTIELIQTLLGLVTPFSTIQTLRQNQPIMESLHRHISTSTGELLPKGQLYHLMGDCRKALTTLEAQVEPLRYLYRPKSDPISLWDHLTTGSHTVGFADPSALLHNTQQVINRFVAYHDSLAASLVEILESAETATAERMTGEPSACAPSQIGP